LGPSPIRGLVLPLAAALALALVPAAAATVHGQGGRSLADQIRSYRATTWHWQGVMGVQPAPARYLERRASLTRLLRLRDRWKHRAVRARKRAHHPPHKAAWLCIRGHEGAWTDPSPPYWGGLQMDLAFQRAYGRGLLWRKGTANRWTPLEQMWTAERAHRSGSGFSPWPNTAGYCGLL
jgi:hypothetical protein